MVLSIWVPGGIACRVTIYATIQESQQIFSLLALLLYLFSERIVMVPTTLLVSTAVLGVMTMLSTTVVLLLLAVFTCGTERSIFPCGRGRKTAHHICHPFEIPAVLKSVYTNLKNGVCIYTFQNAKIPREFLREEEFFGDFSYAAFMEREIFMRQTSLRRCDFQNTNSCFGEKAVITDVHL